ncbi:MarR family winged helix-turn-helix transcriptional regulator [Megamonas hypermegale]|uniref:MarR family winged helix-turn-helix transcriptional regulator n=1 Tax=Megamonas hypermegale TaxID=158847 RepID=UPI00255CADA8|nr:MarR family transcriptional regulator [Megamonas hypermegale]
MTKKIIPTMEELEQHAKKIPEINPSSVLAMLIVKQVADDIQHEIFDILQEKYQLSEGKLHVMIILYQQKNLITPSFLAKKAGVTKATISIMLKRMQRDGLINLISSNEDGRVKKICFTEKGKTLMDDILPAHYLRISKLMGKLEAEEQRELIKLLRKIAS